MFSDYLLLLLLLFLFLFGDMMSWGNSWSAHGFVMTKQDFAKYFDGLVRFTFADPRAVLHGSHYHFAVIHVLLAEIFFVVLPFSKIMHTFFSVPDQPAEEEVGAWTADAWTLQAQTEDLFETRAALGHEAVPGHLRALRRLRRGLPRLRLHAPGAVHGGGQGRGHPQDLQEVLQDGRKDRPVARRGPHHRRCAPWSWYPMPRGPARAAGAA